MKGLSLCRSVWATDDKYFTMNYNWDIIGDKVFGILRGRGYRLQMFDKAGNKTMDPHEATRFFAAVPSQDPSLKNFNILLSLHNEDSSSHMDIKTPTLQNDGDFNTIINLDLMDRSHIHLWPFVYF